MARLQRLPEKKALPVPVYHECACAFCGQKLPRKYTVSYKTQLPDGSITTVTEERTSIVCGCDEAGRRNMHPLGR
jgi:hypothetical protein